MRIARARENARGRPFIIERKDPKPAKVGGCRRRSRDRRCRSIALTIGNMYTPVINTGAMASAAKITRADNGAFGMERNEGSSAMPATPARLDTTNPQKQAPALFDPPPM